MPFYFYKFFWPLAYSTHQAVQPLGSTAQNMPIEYYKGGN